MALSDPNGKVILELNNVTFQENLFGLQKPERHAVMDTFNKVGKLTWSQVYRDNALKWGKIVSVRPPAGIDAIYSMRLTQGRRATATREGAYRRLLTIAPDHESTYGKK